MIFYLSVRFIYWLLYCTYVDVKICDIWVFKFKNNIVRNKTKLLIYKIRSRVYNYTSINSSIHIIKSITIVPLECNKIV